MAWISRAGSLTQMEMENNANIIIPYLRAQNFEDRTIAGILGNMQWESTINPERHEVSGSGYGLVQFTPMQSLIDMCQTLGLSPYTDGNVQLQVILAQLTGNPASLNSWYTTLQYISPYYGSGATADMVGVTATDFISNTMNWNADKLAIMFMAGYERPGYAPEINHYQERMSFASEWYNYIVQYGYTPRLDDSGMLGNFHWYDRNPLYLAGYGLPNCTTYAFGRFWEIGDPLGSGQNYPFLPTGDGGTWWGTAVSQGYYNVGQTPLLGAVICFEKPGESGHVAIVEEIAPDGTITCSNSEWHGRYFFLSTITPVNGRYDWGSYIFQGFIYNPYAYVPPIPPGPSSRKKQKFNWVLFETMRKRQKLALDIFYKKR